MNKEEIAGEKQPITSLHAEKSRWTFDLMPFQEYIETSFLCWNKNIKLKTKKLLQTFCEDP